eukprot:TRINITY_DN73916_c0_g1_i1.p2 TRINITY_DN73916_c0_g1~~TRINITY_DN73916_c0_g1_i1.p2  ORF type:complete len:133 (-),score=7.01 TRINITY_DN73916_c0_g1_i1:126-524(-)
MEAEAYKPAGSTSANSLDKRVAPAVYFLPKRRKRPGSSYGAAPAVVQKKIAATPSRISAVQSTARYTAKGLAASFWCGLDSEALVQTNGSSDDTADLGKPLGTAKDWNGLLCTPGSHGYRNHDHLRSARCYR